MALGVADGDGVSLAGGLVLAEGDGCWVGPGVGEPLGLPDWAGMPWAVRPDGLMLAGPDAELDGRCWRGDRDGSPRDAWRPGRPTA